MSIIEGRAKIELDAHHLFEAADVVYCSVSMIECRLDIACRNVCWRLTTRIEL